MSAGEAGAAGKAQTASVGVDLSPLLQRASMDSSDSRPRKGRRGMVPRALRRRHGGPAGGVGLARASTFNAMSSIAAPLSGAPGSAAGSAADGRAAGGAPVDAAGGEAGFVLSGEAARERRARKAAIAQLRQLSRDGRGGDARDAQRNGGGGGAGGGGGGASGGSSVGGGGASPPSRVRYSWLYRVLSGRSRMRAAVRFNRLLAAMILLSVASFILSTVPPLPTEHDRIFYGAEAVASSFFLVEHAARIYTAPESKAFSSLPAWWARVRYCLTFRGLVDATACLPFFIELLVGSSLPTLTWLKALRIFRVLKTERFTRAFSAVYRVVWFNAEILGVVLFIGLVLMLATSTLLWYFAPQSRDPDDSSDFNSIPATFYLSILMLTGQGTPDGVLPWYTKLIVMTTAVVSVPIFVLPSSILTWGFESEAERLMKKRRERRRKLKRARARGGEPSSSSSSDTAEELADVDSDDMEAEWDEYEAVVLGSDEDDDDADGKDGGPSTVDRELMRQTLEFFAQADTDASGYVSVKEFFRYAQAVQAAMAEQQQAAEEAARAAAAAAHESDLARVESKLSELTAAVAAVAADVRSLAGTKAAAEPGAAGSSA